MFNLCYAQALHAIECLFGVFKAWFWILLLPPHYPFDFQPWIPAALCALQNCIQENDDNEGAVSTDSYQSAYTPFVRYVILTCHSYVTVYI